MKFAQRLRDRRKEEVNPEILDKIVEFGKVYEKVGKIYKILGASVEVIGKGLQTPESSQDIIQCLQNIKNAVLDTAIKLADRHESEFDDVKADVEAFEENEMAEQEERVAAAILRTHERESEDAQVDDHVRIIKEMKAEGASMVDILKAIGVVKDSEEKEAEEDQDSAQAA